MLGWFRLAALCASRRNRSTNDGSVANSGNRTLTATGRSSSWSLARNTSAIPPRARRRCSSYRPLNTVCWDMNPRSVLTGADPLGLPDFRSTPAVLNRDRLLDQLLRDRSGHPSTGSLVGAGLVLDENGHHHLRWLPRRAGEAREPRL